MSKILPYQEPDQHYNHQLRDAWYLSQFHHLHFHDFQSPAEEDCFGASQLLLANRHLPVHDFLVLAKQVFGCLWEHQQHKLATLILRFKQLTHSTTEKNAYRCRQFEQPGQIKAHNCIIKANGIGV
ncbi:MAG: hypothetical protein IPI79_10185 [Moraxellaceae bacterium]|nr:hypothetical protein [Moraxellaceae bacterium]